MAKQIELKITNMECPNCAMILESIEDKLPGVIQAEGSYHKGRLLVDYDENLIGEADIRAAVERLGYQAA